MLSQPRQITNRNNLTPKIKATELFFLYDDFSNGDLSLGSFDGTSPVIGSSVRDSVENVNFLSIVDGVLDVGLTTTSAPLYNLGYTENISFPILMNVVFELNDSLNFIFLGITDDYGVDYRPIHGLQSSSAFELVYRVSDTNFSSGATLTTGTKTSLVLSFVPASGATLDCKLFMKEEGDISYALVSSFTAPALGASVIGLAFRNLADADYYMYRVSAVEQEYQNLAQLEALFPL